MGAQHSPTEAHFIDVTVTQKLSDHGVAHDSTLKPLLVRDAEISMAGTTASVRVRDENGNSVSLDERLSDMKLDPRWRHHFPKGPPTVPASDLRATRENFSEIASGRIKVV
jgi:hypothetical protein